MKKFLPVLVIILVLLVCLCACNKQEEKDDTIYPVVLQPTSEYVGQSLLNYMTTKKTAGELDFTSSTSGDYTMITSINGIENTTNSYWMLYTSDATNADTSWGTYEYNGVTYGSATSGAETLTIISNGVYIWVYTTF